MLNVATPDIARRLAGVQERISHAAAAAGRDPAAVRLVTVTKGFPVETVLAAVQAGLRCFGENRVEQLAARMGDLADLAGVEWHLIGPLQSRKVRLVPVSTGLIHAVDRLRIARRLEAHAADLGVVLPILLECNVSGEASKSGWRLEGEQAWEQAAAEVEEIAALEHLALRGLMTMAPLGATVEEQRSVFGRLARLRDFLIARLRRPLPELSMGMSDDFEAAVAEGATLVRIGRAILGERM
jgi:hypothetical protein